MDFLKKHVFTFTGILIGALAGFAYWHFIGCEESCTIRSVWYHSTMYGALMGGLLANIGVGFFKGKTKGEQE